MDLKQLRSCLHAPEAVVGHGHGLLKAQGLKLLKGVNREMTSGTSPGCCKKARG